MSFLEYGLVHAYIACIRTCMCSTLQLKLFLLTNNLVGPVLEQARYMRAESISLHSTINYHYHKLKTAAILLSSPNITAICNAMLHNLYIKFILHACQLHNKDHPVHVSLC